MDAESRSISKGRTTRLHLFVVLLIAWAASAEGRNRDAVILGAQPQQRLAGYPAAQQQLKPLPIEDGFGAAAPNCSEAYKLSDDLAASWESGDHPMTESVAQPPSPRWQTALEPRAEPPEEMAQKLAQEMAQVSLVLGRILAALPWGFAFALKSCGRGNPFVVRP